MYIYLWLCVCVHEQGDCEGQKRPESPRAGVTGSSESTMGAENRNLVL